MLNSITYRKKNLLLIVVAFLLGWVAWHYALKNTWELAERCEEMETKIAAAGDAGSTIASLQKERAQLDKILGSSDRESERVQQQLYDIVSLYCKKNNLQLQEFPEPHSATENEYAVRTMKVVVAGNYKELLHMVNTLESEFKSARLVSVHYRTELNRKTRKTELYATLWFQNIEKV